MANNNPKSAYYWVEIDGRGEEEIAQFTEGHGYAYTCDDEQGWPIDRVKLLRKIRPFKRAEKKEG